jgi:hypothetical protein
MMSKKMSKQNRKPLRLVGGSYAIGVGGWAVSSLLQILARKSPQGTG